MNIKEDLYLMFRETSRDYATSIVPRIAVKDDEVETENEHWTEILDAYQEGVKNVIEFMFNNYDVYSKESFDDLRKRVDAIVYCQCPEPDRESGYTYCNRCHKHVNFNIPDQEELERKNLREREYNNLCARATLYPGKTIDEVIKILQHQRIEIAYKSVNDILCNTKPINNRETRQWVIKMLQRKLDAVVVRCDEELNSPEVIDQNLLIAEAIWNSDYSNEYQIKKVLLVFGEIQQVEKYQRQHYFDNETYKFIQKGI
jgi:hypothetical protein